MDLLEIMSIESRELSAPRGLAHSVVLTMEAVSAPGRWGVRLAPVPLGLLTPPPTLASPLLSSFYIFRKLFHQNILEWLEAQTH